MGTLFQDVRFGLRMLLRKPGFSAAAVLSLALGIGANTTIFTWIKSVLLQPLPAVASADRLLTVHGVMTRSGDKLVSVSYPDYVDFRDRNDVFSGMLADSLIPLSLTGGGQPERIWGCLVSGNFFEVLGVKAVMGRTFLPEEDKTQGTHPVAVLSYGFWQRRFGADRGLIGRTVTINNRPFTIVGVAPRGFTGASVGIVQDVWIPLMAKPLLVPPGDESLNARGSEWLQVMGRLKPGVTLEQARSNLQAIASRLAREYPAADEGHDVAVFTLSTEPYGAQGILSTALLVLMAVAGLVLIIACANVANLLLARAVARRREIGIRLALGASRGRLLRQLLTESIVLSSLGGALGVLLALWAAGSLTSFIPPIGYQVSLDLSLDTRVLIFALLVTLVTGLLFGLMPALQATSSDVLPTLKEEAGSLSGDHRKSRLRNAFVVAQIALSMVALIGAGLLIRSLQKAASADPGFNPDGVLLASLDLFPNGYDRARGQEFYRQLMERLAALPEVQSVSLADKLPLRLFGDTSEGATVEGYSPRADEELNFDYDTVGPGYFHTIGMPLAEGREFTSRDDERAPAVVIINQTMAKRYFHDQDALGRRLRDGNGTWRQIIGIARDAKYYTLDQKPQPYVYFPVSQRFRSDMTLLVRAQGSPAAVLASVRREIQSLDATLPIFDVKTLAQFTGISLVAQRLAATLLSIFGLLALTLAAIGLYSVMAYSVVQRTREIGVRMALGANSAQVLRLFARQGLKLSMIGLAVGLIFAFALSRVMSSLLYGITTTDPATFIGVSVLLGAVALLASYLPAWRATRVDPLVALRYE